MHVDVVVAVVSILAALEEAKRKAPRKTACNLTIGRFILWNSINILPYKSTFTGSHFIPFPENQKICTRNPPTRIALLPPPHTSARRRCRLQGSSIAIKAEDTHHIVNNTQQHQWTLTFLVKDLPEGSNVGRQIAVIDNKSRSKGDQGMPGG